MKLCQLLVYLLLGLKAPQIWHGFGLVRKKKQYFKGIDCLSGRLLRKRKCINDWVPSPDIPFLDSSWKYLLVGKLIKSCSWIKHKITCSLLNKVVSQTSDKFADKIFMLVHVNCNSFMLSDCCHDKHTDILLQSHICSCLQPFSRFQWENKKRAT